MCALLAHLAQSRQSIKILFVTLGSAREACSRVRIFQYLPYLNAHGVEVDVEPFFPDVHDDQSACTPSIVKRVADAQYVWRRALRVALRAPAYDVVFLQRVLLPPALHRFLRRRARRLVFDFDDAIYTGHRGAQYGAADAPERFVHTIGSSDAVIASTPYLCERASRHQRKVHYIPSAVDCERYRPREPRRCPGDEVIVGWIGSGSTTMYLEPVLPLLRRLASPHDGVRVELVGARLSSDDSIRVHEWRLDDECARLARFDIGIMPLDDDEWSAGKGGYKLLQYMASGIPSVVSSVGVGPRIIRHGETGFVATTASDWEGSLRRLVADDQLRQRLGRQARSDVERDYSIARWAPILLEVLASCAAA